jgi:hypothetical protein
MEKEILVIMNIEKQVIREATNLLDDLDTKVNDFVKYIEDNIHLFKREDRERLGVYYKALNHDYLVITVALNNALSDMEDHY